MCTTLLLVLALVRQSWKDLHLKFIGFELVAVGSKLAWIRFGMFGQGPSWSEAKLVCVRLSTWLKTLNVACLLLN